ncbi:hypothetical protein Sjap_012552 [Stephania japonica]|uniref:Uncharacterized protein n=1 Tax=Stephania japonica TaxID=461633 RepID=A0AAP0NZ12_9MAGN
MANSEQLEASEKELHGKKAEDQEEAVSVELTAPKGWKKKFVSSSIRVRGEMLSLLEETLRLFVA